MDNKLLLSIFVLTYNHEKFVRKALDSILCQRTKYNYEVIIGDDASTDNTPAILKEYQEKYPNKIKVFFRKKNMGGNGANNLLDLIKKCSGKYIIALEGDDYWIDRNKIEKQIDFLETNQEYIGIAHKCVVVDENSIPNGEKYPECMNENYSFRHLASNIMPGQLTTLMYRNIYINKYDYSLLEKELMPADRLIYFILLCYGNIYCMNQTLSAYRHITEQGSSFSANVKWEYKKNKKWNKAIVDYSKKINNKEAIKYSELMLMKTIIGSRKRDNIKWKTIFYDLRNENIPFIRYLQYIKQLILRIVLKKEIWA